MTTLHASWKDLCEFELVVRRKVASHYSSFIDICSGKLQRKTNDTAQTTNNESSGKVSIPSGFESDIQKAQQLQALVQQDPTAMESLIGVLEGTLARLPPGENLSLWVSIEYSLGNAYTKRKQGVRDDNFKKAIQYYNNSLRVLPRESYPDKWAMIEKSLGDAYSNLQTDRAKNLDLAIEHYNSSLQVWTRENYSDKWAEAENSLGSAYYDKSILEDPVENIEQAIKHLNNTLQVYAREKYPDEWATIEYDLGVAYSDRIKEDRAENLELAKLYLENSLQIRALEKEKYPDKWADTENALGSVYIDRIKGDRAGNLEQAIWYLDNSLQVRSLEKEKHPAKWAETWAETKINLGNAYYKREQGVRDDNIKRAIQYYSNSLQVLTRENDSNYWAEAENGLGVAHSNLQSDRAKNLEQAINYYNNSLQVWTREGYPDKWAMAETNLGIAYSNLQSDRTRNLKVAMQHYNNALQVYTANSFPRDFRTTESLLGDIYFEQGQWQDALDAYNKSIEVGEQLYRVGLSSESKSEEMKENSAFYRNAAFAAVRLNKTVEAFLILEKGKTRLLAEELRLSAKRPDKVPDKNWTNYENATKAYRALQDVPLPKENSPQAQNDREKKSQEALNATDAAIKDIQKYEPTFHKSLEVNDTQKILDNKTALLSFCVTKKGGIVFVVTHDKVEYVDLPGFNSTDLTRLMVEQDDHGNITGGWFENMSSGWFENRSQPISDQTRIMAVMEPTIEHVLKELGQKLIKPVAAEIPASIKNLILLPSSGLFLLPIHAAPISDGNELLCDKFVVSYAPSTELLIEMKDKAKERTGKSFYAVVNPRNDLAFATCESANISKCFENPRLDNGPSCTPASVLNHTRGQAYLHFSCHGQYDWGDPSQSALLLNNGNLTLADLQNNESSLSSARLVTMSACESGIADVLVGSADEYVGLPAGFMLSGAPCVVSSLWPVDEVATSLLMERFYSNHIIRGMSTPSSLQEAQQWIRGLTNSEIAAYVKDCADSVNGGKEKYYLAHYSREYNKLAKDMPEAKPFDHPYFWAGFTVNGV